MSMPRVAEGPPADSPSSVDRTRVAIALFALMAAAGAAGLGARALIAPSSQAAPVDLDRMVPAKFGEWTLQPSSALLVNPQTQALIDQLYSQTLSRTYANAAGYRVMLSLAYGSDQRLGLQAHLPEVCYPAQGFTIREQSEGRIATSFGAIPVKRLHTEQGSRVEPVTYWLTMGEQVLQTRSRFEKRLIELRFGLTGNVPDGLLFRVSSIDARAGNAYEMQERFVRDLLGAVALPERVRLAGLRS
jgi:EpsI family protein